MATKNMIHASVGTTAVQLVAANANRQSLVFRVERGRAYLSNDNTVTVATGFPWGVQDGPFTDDVPSLDAWWAIAAGDGCDIRGVEVSS